MGRLFKFIQRAYKNIRSSINSLIGIILLLLFLGIAGRLGDFLQVRFNPQSTELLASSFSNNALMILGYAIQAGMILYFLDRITKRREHKTLGNVRKATFGKILSRADAINSMLLEAAEREWLFFKYEKEMSERLADKVPEAFDVETGTVNEDVLTERVLDTIQGEFIEEKEESYLMLERHYQGILDQCSALIYYVDDQIETHISALDFESGYIANELRTRLRDFLQYTQSEHQRIVGYEKINRSLQQRLIRKATRIGRTQATVHSYRSKELGFRLNHSQKATRVARAAADRKLRLSLS